MLWRCKHFNRDSYYRNAQNKLEAATDDRGLMQMKAALREAMTQRFASVKKAPHVLAATLLDPCFKDMYFEELEKNEAASEILKFLTPKALSW